MIHKTVVFCRLIALMGVGFLWAWLGAFGCGAVGTGGSASPVASIPLPTNTDPITVSAPDSQGYVTVTGSAASLIPDNAVVIIEVQAASSAQLSSGPSKLAMLPFIRDVWATTCASDLPQCPTLEDQRCQGLAATDGSFSVQVPATVTDEIVVYYLDASGTCSETAAYAALINEDIVSVPVDAVAMAYDATNEQLYVLGDDENGIAKIFAFDPVAKTHAEVTGSFLLTGAARDIDLFFDTAMTLYLVVKTANELVLVDAADTSQFKNIVAEDNYGTLVDVELDYLYEMEVDYDASSDSCVSSQVLGSGAVYKRIFFTGSDTLWMLEMGAGFSAVHANNVYDEDTLSLRNKPVVVSGANANLSFEDVDFLHIESDTKFMAVISFSDTENPSYVWHSAALYDNALSAVNFCYHTDLVLTVGAAGTSFSLGHSAGDVHIRPVSSPVMEENDYIFLNRDEQTMTFLGESIGSSMSFFCLTESDVLLADGLDTTAADFGTDCAVLYALSETGIAEIFVTGYELAVNNTSYAHYFVNSNGTAELFLLGANNGLSDFMLAGGATSLLEPTDEVINVIDPKGFDYDSSNNQIITVDAGLAGDASSNVVLYPLASEPMPQ